MLPTCGRCVPHWGIREEQFRQAASGHRHPQTTEGEADIFRPRIHPTVQSLLLLAVPPETTCERQEAKSA